MASAQSVGLILSGGGAKGLSHIGVIRALEENNIPIDYICGTSMGSIIGGMYAAGMTCDEMMEVFKSDEFVSWYQGKAEKEYATAFYKMDPTPTFVSISFNQNKGKKEGKSRWKVSLPTSLVSAYPMDAAVMQLFGSASAAANYDFDQRMVPFFCVSSDIVRKKEFISRNGDLGSAIRASMSYPFYFKPVVIDSTLLFDGGFYNNFPWEKMEEFYDPDFLIGVKCVKGDANMPEDDDIIAQVETMLTTDTDYSIPEENGVLVKGIYDYGLMEFDKVEEISQKGYEIALKYIDEIKERIPRRTSDEELLRKRMAFRSKMPAIKFDSIHISGDFTKDQAGLVEEMLKNGKEKKFSFEDFKKGYYQLVASETVKAIYPVAERHTDTSFTLNIKANKYKSVKLSVGGNISSSTLNQGYIGVLYTELGKTIWTTAADLYIGRFYTGLGLKFRHNFSIQPMAFYEVEGVCSNWDYFAPTVRFLSNNARSVSINSREAYLSARIGTELKEGSDFLAKFAFNAGFVSSDYYTTDFYSNYDYADRTVYRAIMPSFRIERHNTDFIQYPTSGYSQSFSINFTYGQKKNRPGTTSDPGTEYPYKMFYDARLRLRSEQYYKLSKWFSLGFNVDLNVGLDVKGGMGNYKAALLYTPGYDPFPHATTVLMDNYRAPQYLGLSINPVFKITNTIYFHTAIAYFQPYRLLREGSKGTYTLSDPLPRGGFLGNLAAVWQSPIGPISLSVSYYERSDIKWYPQFNLGFILFKKHFIDN